MRRLRALSATARGVAVWLALLSHLLLACGLPLPTPCCGASPCGRACGCPAEERRLERCCCCPKEEAAAPKKAGCCSEEGSCCGGEEPAAVAPEPEAVRWVSGLIAARCKGVSPAGLYQPDPSPPAAGLAAAPALPDPEGYIEEVTPSAEPAIRRPPSPPPRRA